MSQSQTPPRFSQGAGPWQSHLARVSLASEWWWEALSNYILRKDTNFTSPRFESEVWARGSAKQQLWWVQIHAVRGLSLQGFTAIRFPFVLTVLSYASWFKTWAKKKRCSLTSSVAKNSSKLRLSEWAEATHILALPLTTWAESLTSPVRTLVPTIKWVTTIAIFFCGLLQRVTNSHNLLIFLFSVEIGKIFHRTVTRKRAFVFQEEFSHRPPETEAQVAMTWTSFDAWVLRRGKAIL